MPISTTFKAVLWMLGTVASLTTMAVSGREMSSELDTFEIMMYRSFIGVIIVVVIGKLSGTFKSVSRQRFGLHLIRNISHFTAQNLWFYALALIPLAQVFALEFSTPLWVALFAPFFLGEKLTKVRIFTIILGFCGILIVAQPGNISLSSGVIAAALCAIGFAGSLVATKLLARTESITCIMFWLVTMQFVLGVVCAFYDGDVAIPSVNILPLVFLIGVAGVFAHYCLTCAFKLAPILFISPLDFLRLPIIAIIGAVFYNEGINIWLIIGGAIIFGSNLLNLWVENKGVESKKSVQPRHSRDNVGE